MFYLWLKQTNEGYNYTGEKLITLSASTLEEAYLESKEHIYKQYDFLTNAYIFSDSYNLDWMINEAVEKNNEKKKQQELQLKRAQFERLKKELGE